MALLNLTWTLTGLAAVVVLITRTRLGAEKQSGVSVVPSAIVNAHTVVGVLALAAWITWLAGGPTIVGYAAVALWWLVVLVGLLVLARWLPSHGSHAQEATDDALSRGPGLSILGHVGMLLGVGFFTWFMLADKLV